VKSSVHHQILNVEKATLKEWPMYLSPCKEKQEGFQISKFLTDFDHPGII